jgi:hypothetical protein
MKKILFSFFHFIKILILLVTFIYHSYNSPIKSSKDNKKNCQFLGVLRENGEYWLHQNFFNVTCIRGRIQAYKFYFNLFVKI